jgi:hypothetical protein
MNTSTADQDREVPLNCPKCGAPAKLPGALDELVVTCRFCNETYTVPRSIREARERRLFQLRGQSVSGSSNTTVLVATLIGTSLLAVLVYGLVVYRMNQGPPATTRAEPPQKVQEPEIVTTIPQEIVVDKSFPEGEVWVKERLAFHEANGCKVVLLPATRITGGRDIDAKLVANGPCVRLLASSGTSGDSLELNMQTPKGMSVVTPAPASTLDFLYCPKLAGLHPASIRSSGDNPFTVSSIECPRNAKK